jgi:phenolic acid decarboxylase
VFIQRYNTSNIAVGDPVQLQSQSGLIQDGLVRVAALTNGSYVVTWSGDNGVSTSNVYTQIFDQDNNPAGSLQTFDAVGSTVDWNPQVTALNGGGYVLAWWAATTDGEGTDIFLQAYAANGTTLGTQHRLSSATGANEGFPAITALSDGGFVVSWSGNESSGGQDIFVQRYDDQAQTSATLLQVSGQSGNPANYDPNACAMADGGFVLTWDVLTNDGESYDIFVQRFDALNAPVYNPLRLQVQNGSFDAYRPKIAALSDGGYVVVWNELADNGQSYDVFIQRFAADDSRVGLPALQVTAGNALSDWEPNLAALPNGGYVVAWYAGVDGDWADQDIYVQQYDANNQPVSAPQPIRGMEGNDEDWGRTTITVLQDGSYVVSWLGGTSDGQGYDIFAQRFEPNGLRWTGNLDRIDLATDASANTLKLSLSDVLDLSGTNLFNDSNGWAGLGTTVQRHQLVVDGTSADTVKQVAGLDWTQDGTVTNGAETYNVWNHNSSAAQLLIDSNINRVVL